MPLTDELVVEFLVEATERPLDPVRWREDKDGTLLAQVRGIEVELQNVPSRAGSQLFLRFTDRDHEVYLAEPPRTSLFGNGYKDEGQKRLAYLMKELVRQVESQIARRRMVAGNDKDKARQDIYRRLILGDDPDVDKDWYASAESRNRKK